MKKLLSPLILYCLCTIFSYAHATAIPYNIIGGVDTEGNAFSGHVEINSNPYLSDNGCFLYYDISKYRFISDAGICNGDSGLLRFDIYLDNTTIMEGNSSAYFYNTYIANNVGKLNSSLWSNSMTGVFFVGAEATVSGYSTLPQEIRICADMMAGGSNLEGYWGPAWGQSLILDRCPAAPVPEPCTILLLGSGLLGLAGFRRKLKQ